jgi:hypothetical protein
LYALAEVFIGCSALTVPVQLLWGHPLLEWTAERAALSSATYYLASGAFVALTVIPWCACMGATIPLAMFAIRSDSRYETRRSFSPLYLANVSGAVFGAICPLFLIELQGFHRTLRVGALLNALIAASAFGMSFANYRRGAVRASTQPQITTNASGQGKRVLLLLFAAGLTTMGMEVVWIRGKVHLCD